MLSGPAPRPGLMQQLGLTGLLAARDLRDEALLSVCLVSAIAAVLAPIMILAGLKFGFIDILRSKLVHDPSYRLVTPTQSVLRPPSFFDKLRARDDVAFVQPNVNLSGTSANLAPKGQRVGKSFDVVPTSAGDPLIVENGGKVPGPDEVTLSSEGAALLGVKPGDAVTAMITRSNAGKVQRQQIELKVASVLDASADPRTSAYVDLGLVLDIERYRSGIPVSARKWEGIANPPAQSFDGVYVLLAEPMTEVDINSLRVGQGFARSEPVEAADFERMTGLSAGDSQQIIRLDNEKKAVRGRAVEAVGSELSSREHRILPVIDELRVSLVGAPGEQIGVRSFDAAAFPLRQPSAPAPPEDRVSVKNVSSLKLLTGRLDKWRLWKADASYGLVDKVLVPKALAERLKLKAGDRIELGLAPASPDDATSALVFKAYVDGIVEGDWMLMHPSLAGMLHASRSVALSYDPTLNTLIAADPGLRGFRLYGTTIDVVPELARSLIQAGEEVNAKVDTIERVQNLDRALTRMILIVGLVALIGGTAVMVASFYAAVERKKGELSLLRLLGFSKGSIFSMPIQQSLMLAAMGFALALAAFLAFSYLINTQYAADLALKGEICRLEPWHIGVFLGLTLLIALASSLIAAARTMMIEPAEALRIE